MLLLRTQKRGYLPILGEGANIDATRGAARNTKNIGMTEGKPKGSVTTHRVTRNGACRAVGVGAIVRVYISDEFLRNEGLIFERWVNRAIPIPTMVTAVGHYDYHIILVGQTARLGVVVPSVKIVAAAVQQEEVYYQYSGYMAGLIHLTNALYSADPDLYFELRSNFSDYLEADLNANSRYWTEKEGKLNAISDTVYEAFLHVNNQPSGLRSYGECVDLLVLWLHNSDFSPMGG